MDIPCFLKIQGNGNTMKRNIKLLMEYDGGRYDGWQRLGKKSGGTTIQGKIEEVLSKMTGDAVELIGSGRTDAGVHARGQVANFHTNSDMKCWEMKYYLNRYLPQDIGVLYVSDVPEKFHSRLNAKSKRYIYRVATGDVPSVFDRRYTWYCFDRLDTGLMKEGAALMLGEHDFKGFSSVKKTNKSTVRTVSRVDMDVKEREIDLIFEGNGFLYHMVRIMAGTLIEIGTGDREAETVKEVFRTRDREKAGITLPPQGLFLDEVFYE